MTSMKSICNEKEYEQLHKNYAEKLYRQMYKLCKDGELAKDLVQNAFMKLWDNCKNVTFEKARGYIFRTARNDFLNILILRKHPTNRTLSWKQEYENICIDDFEGEDERLEQIIKLIELLPKRNKRIFLKRINTDLTLDEIGAQENVSETMIRRIINNTIKKLKEFYKKKA